ncbi:YcaO-like family protein [Rhizomonospora bruguierae]|uniref:YcaO-like family protein n=1 Tax=Rhizomonospora bruguierae TaxID=1581705 RepID=UPI001BCBB71D|nr:YcaO-like family protein [Micromonospora sp. NBRC 107566]
MLDVVALLDPAAGLVTSAQVVPPAAGESPFWRYALELDCGHHSMTRDRGELDPCVAGACASTRTRAVVRAAGEAVERLALHAVADLSVTATELGDKALRYWDPAVALADPPGPERSLRWFTATRLLDGSPRFVPDGLVVYPAGGGQAGFDPGPSGAASGVGYWPALHSALLETVERDAVIVGWARQQRLWRVDVDAELAAAPADPEWAELRRSVGLVRRVGLDVLFARIPLALPGLTCVVGGVRGAGRFHPLISLGAKVSWHPAAALYGALHESMQLYPALLHFETPDDHREVVVTESDRMRFLASASGPPALSGWLDDAVPHQVPATPGEPEAEGIQAQTEILVARLLADGLDPYLVDLSSQLPPRVRALGWSAVKVVPVGYQPLRIDERMTSGWHRGRLASLEVRTGSTARCDPQDPCPLPHPLP